MCKSSLFKKLFVAVPLALSLLSPQISLAKTDSYIFTDQIENTYMGREESASLINNLNFTDMPSDPSAQDAVVRSGALNIIQPTERRFNPDQIITKQEAIAYALRAAGREVDLRAAINRAQANLAANSPIRDAWWLGYMNMAMQSGLIDGQQYADAVAPSQEGYLPEYNFIREDPATREEVAFWLTTALDDQQQDIFGPLDRVNRTEMFSYEDWDQIDPDMEVQVEAMLRNHVMEGRDSTHFSPKGTVTREDMARILRNLDSFSYGLLGLEKKTGTVAGLADEQYNETLNGQAWRLAYIRTADGSVDQLQYELINNSDPRSGPLDAVVLREGTVGGLQTLREGDQIEYLVETETNELRYVQVLSEMNVNKVRARLQLIDTTEGVLTFTDEAGRTYQLPMISGLYGDYEGEEIIKFGTELRPVSSLPLGTFYNVTMVNNVVTSLEYVGDPVLEPEIRGIVTENNPLLGYLTVLDENGAEVTKTYNEGDLLVQKREFYDMRDVIGSVHSMFPDFNYNPQETEMSAIEVGDIVSFRVAPDDPERIISISAATNYTTRYGRVMEFRDDGGVYQMLMEFENGATAWFNMVDGVPVLKAGRLTAFDTIVSGDWAQLLVNQAVIGPGMMMESVKEVRLEGDGHQISSIIKGRMAGFNTIQNTMNIQDAEQLTLNGWADYQQLSQVDMDGKDISFYYDGEPVTPSYVNQYLKRADGTVYIAMENNYAGEKVKMISIRTGRDEQLQYDTIMSSGNDGMTMLSNNGAVTTDEGTIVRRNGRLVPGSQIAGSDYAMISLNGGNQAAVVDINPPPATRGVGITMGIVFSVDQGRSFQIGEYRPGRNETSGFLHIFNGFGWDVSPQVNRVFTIDNNTMFIGAAGTTIDSFITYSPESVAGNVYTIVYEGSRAVRVIEMPVDPFPNRFMRGTVYAVDGNTISIRDTQVYNDDAALPENAGDTRPAYNSQGGWATVNPGDTTATITTQDESIIIDRNQLIRPGDLQVGQQILICTDLLPTEDADGNPVDPGTAATAVGYIIQVER